MFQSLMERFESNLARMLFRLEPASSQYAPTSAQEGRGKMITPENTDNTQTSTNEEALEMPSSQPVTAKTIGRNDPCWCGSGKKWKKCHYPELG